MAAPQLLLVDAIIARIQAEVTGANVWKTFRFEPINHPGDGDYLAVWFDSEVNHAEGNTTADGGHLDQRETYGVRFWRQAPEGTRGVVDDGAAAAVLDLYNLTYRVLQQNQTYAGTVAYFARPIAGGPMIGGATEAKIRGFTITLLANAARGFNG